MLTWNIIETNVNIFISHVDIIMLHVNRITLPVDMNGSLVNIIMLCVVIIYLARTCKAEICHHTVHYIPVSPRKIASHLTFLT